MAKILLYCFYIKYVWNITHFTNKKIILTSIVLINKPLVLTADSNSEKLVVTWPALECRLTLAAHTLLGYRVAEQRDRYTHISLNTHPLRCTHPLTHKPITYSLQRHIKVNLEYRIFFKNVCTFSSYYTSICH